MFKLKSPLNAVEYHIEFDSKPNLTLLAQIQYILRSNSRHSKAQAKTRGEVSGGGKKPWKQKGTGRARHGSTRSPIWVGGGVVFGPSSEVNNKKKYTKKMYISALKSAFNQALGENKIIIVDSFKLNPVKTSVAVKMIKSLTPSNKVLVIDDKNMDLRLALRNCPEIIYCDINDLSSLQLIEYPQIIISFKAISSKIPVKEVKVTIPKSTSKPAGTKKPTVAKK